MAPKTSRLRGGVALNCMNDNSNVSKIRPTMNTRAEPDLGWGQQEDSQLVITLTRPSLRVSPGRYSLLHGAERHPLSYSRHIRPFLSEGHINISEA